MDTAAHSPACRNCGASLAGRYCAQCGQQDRPLNPTLRTLASDAIQHGFDLDGALLRSVRLLFTRPGLLTTELLAGRRARYVSPFRLYLLFSVIALATTAFTADRALVTQEGDVIEIGMGFRVFLSAADGPEDRQRYLDQAQQLLALRKAWLPRVIFVVVPLAALVVMGVTRRARRNYPQHFYFTLHLLAVVFAGMTLVALMPPTPQRALSGNWTEVVFDSPGFVAAMVVGVAIWVYGTMAFRRVYGGGWGVNIVRTAVLSVVYGAVVFAALWVMLLTVIGDW